MNDGAILIIAAFAAALPVLLLFLARVLGSSHLEAPWIKSTAAYSSSFGGLLFIVSALFLASKDIGEVAAIGVVPGIFLWMAIYTGTKQLAEDISNERT